MPIQDFSLPVYIGNGSVSAAVDSLPFEQDLVETHFHIPGEQLINGLRYPLEYRISFISTDPTARIKGLMLSILFREGNFSPFIESYINGDIVDFSTLIPSPIEDYFFYSGGRDRPVPDCDEPYLYILLNQIFELSADQVAALSSGPYARAIAEAAFHGLYRDTQPTNGRTVYERVSMEESGSFLY